ncbi:class I SAM-dependent DNA methyltransferase [Chamaesiphon sp.]|uniref:class I SAM-dependent DNA methyltransferase n=1 Tax=Chamaesiphon sp. TaxID=2814140 RepID=UPI0035944265
MNAAENKRVEDFLTKWLGSEGNERANYQTFFGDLCVALDVPEPPPKGSVEGDKYCFDKNIKFFGQKAETTRFADFYKEGCFLIEAKQGSTNSTKGHGKRGTKGYRDAMQQAFNQAKSYAYNRMLPSLPPLLITCDIGSHFEVWEGFSGEYGSYGARQTINLKDLAQPEIFDRFVAIFTDPQSLNPEKYRARVTREVAAELAKLSRWLEDNAQVDAGMRGGVRLKPPLVMQSLPTQTKSSLTSPDPKSAKENYKSQSAKADFTPRASISIDGGIDGEPSPVSAHEVANFLMRCIFTMFAEDVELLKGEVFSKALRERWIPNPQLFKPEIEQLWQTMNTGGTFGFERVLRFNGSFFEEATAFDLPKEQLEVLYAAAAKDWSQVEPAIFGTLLERALEKKERSRLGAHYTPRSYVERLVRPVVMEPLRQQWDEIELELKRLLETAEGKEPTAAQRKQATQEIQAFLTQLRQVKILDPACGTGNFLYVTLDLLKGLEQEAIARLVDVAGEVQLGLEQINPAQFLGIEINPRAAAIAELVIWIGYLQWYFKRYGNAAPPEPVLQAFGNIECRDAVLAYDGMEPDLDAKTGEIRSRWGGKMMKHPVTGEDVPDPLDRVIIYKYLNPRAAEWPKADYIVSNPPFIGNSKMRKRLGDGYVEALRTIYKEIPDTVDYVMYWWHKAAVAVQAKQLTIFGFITTNSINQIRLRSIIEHHVNQKKSIELVFAIPDHPWTDEGAAVRIAMTSAELHQSNKIKNIPRFGIVISEGETDIPEETAEQIIIDWKSAGKINSNLTIGIDITSVKSLVAQSKICGTGVKVYGAGFILDRQTASNLNSNEASIVRPYKNGRDITQQDRNVFVIDCFGMTEKDVQNLFPSIFQILLERVYPQRIVERDEKIKENWWLFERNRPELRQAIQDLRKFIVSVETAKHRVFSFLDATVIPDVKLTVIALDDAYFLGILSSYLHTCWALGTGRTLEDRPVYTKTTCFDAFPFPDPTPEQKQKIRELGDRLDSHRKQVQAAHPDITITGMYNLLEKLRAGTPFSELDRAYNNRALVSTLNQIHDELDTAVFAAYGWQDLSGKPTAEIAETILERLVALNAERAAEERNGHIRWLRPEYQAPTQTQSTQIAIAGIDIAPETAVTPVEQQKWPTQPKAQLAAIRDLLRTSSGEWTVLQIANQFTGKNTQKKLDAIGENLDRLEWFGVVIDREDTGITYWQYAEIQQTA